MPDLASVGIDSAAFVGGDIAASLKAGSDEVWEKAKGIKLQEIRAATGELQAACNRKIEAAEDFGILVKVIAMKAGVDPSVLSTYVTAVCNDTLKKKERQAGQLTLLFDQLA